MLMASRFRLRFAVAPTRNLHVLEINVRSESTVSTFTRCDATPEPFDLEDAENVAAGARIVSSAPTITGIESPVPVEVIDGDYSIGCGSTFTHEPGFDPEPQQTICVRHTASDRAGGFTETYLIVGNEWGSFGRWPAILHHPILHHRLRPLHRARLAAAALPDLWTCCFAWLSCLHDK